MAPDDGWTYVGRGKGKRQDRRNRPAKEFVLSPTTLNTIDPDATIKRAKADFESKTKIWQASSCRKQYYQKLNQHQPDEGWELDRAICLASGSFSRENLTSRKRSMQQLAAFVDIVRYLQKTSSTTIEMYAQDPVYTFLDKDLLATLDITVLEFSLDDKLDLDQPVDPILGPVFRFGPAQNLFGPRTMVAEFCMESGFEVLRAFLSANVKLYAASTFGMFMDGSFPTYESCPMKMALHPSVTSRDPMTDGCPGDSPPVPIFFGNEERDVKLRNEFKENYISFDWPLFEEDSAIFWEMVAYVKRDDEKDECEAHNVSKVGC